MRADLLCRLDLRCGVSFTKCEVLGSLSMLSATVVRSFGFSVFVNSLWLRFVLRCFVLHLSLRILILKVVHFRRTFLVSFSGLRVLVRASHGLVLLGAGGMRIRLKLVVKRVVRIHIVLFFLRTIVLVLRVVDSRFVGLVCISISVLRSRWDPALRQILVILGSGDVAKHCLLQIGLAVRIHVTTAVWLPEWLVVHAISKNNN